MRDINDTFSTLDLDDLELDIDFSDMDIDLDLTGIHELLKLDFTDIDRKISFDNKGSHER